MCEWECKCLPCDGLVLYAGPCTRSGRDRLQLSHDLRWISDRKDWLSLFNNHSYMSVLGVHVVPLQMQIEKIRCTLGCTNK